MTIKQFINPTASQIASIEMLWGVVQMEGFIASLKGGGTGRVCYHADHITDADQEISVWLNFFK